MYLMSMQVKTVVSTIDCRDANTNNEEKKEKVVTREGAHEV
jgi:hypothetical protein